MARDKELKNMIALLVAKGADINAIDENGENIIHYLTLQCKGDLIRYAVQMGADINHENEDFGTPLLRASKVFRDSIPVLLEAGADPNYVSSKGGVLTPLIVAAVVAPNPTIVIQTLLDGGADINLDAGDGSALIYAKLRANGRARGYGPYSRIHDMFVNKISSNCPLAKADFAQKQSLEEWQRKGQEAVDMLLAHGAKGDVNPSVDEDIVVANISAILSVFNQGWRG